MDSLPKATVGVAGHFDPLTRRGGWAVVIHLDGRQIALFGVQDRTGTRECERHALQEAMRALRKLRAPLQAIEVSLELKRALLDTYRPKGRSDPWGAPKTWWKSAGKEAGLRVTRRRSDVYSAAAAMAEIAALSNTQRPRLAEGDLDTPGNRSHQLEQAQRRAERNEKRIERKQRSSMDEDNAYGLASGNDRPRPRPPPGYAFAPTSDADLAQMIESLQQ